MVVSVVGEVTILVCACMFLFTAPIFLHAKKKPHKMEMTTTTEPPPEHHDHYHDYEDIPSDDYKPHDPPPGNSRRYTPYNKRPLSLNPIGSPYGIRKDSYYKALLDSYNSAYKSLYQNVYKTAYHQDQYGRFKREVANTAYNYSEKVPKDFTQDTIDIPNDVLDELQLLETALKATHELRPKDKISKKKKQIYLKNIINSRKKRSLNSLVKGTNEGSNSHKSKYKKNSLSDGFSRVFKKRLRRTAADKDSGESENRLISIITLPEEDNEYNDGSMEEEQTTRHHRLVVPLMF